MGFFNFFQSNDINQGVEEWKNTEKAILIDVRTIAEYSEGHIPGSINIPLDQIYAISSRVKDKDTPLFVHCLSGARSGRAVQAIKQMGYTNVKNIGGINSYRGNVEV